MALCPCIFQDQQAMALALVLFPFSEDHNQKRPKATEISVIKEMFVESRFQTVFEHSLADLRCDAQATWKIRAPLGVGLRVKGSRVCACCILTWS